MAKCATCEAEVRLSLKQRLLRADPLCDACRAAKMAKLEQFRKKLREAGADFILTSDEERDLVELQQSLGLLPEELQEERKYIEQLRDRTHATHLSRYRAAQVEAVEDIYLSQEEDEALSSLRVELGLSQADIAGDLLALSHLRTLSRIRDGELPIVDDPGILLTRGEQCHWMAPARLMEEKTRTHYVGGSQGVSFRIAKGVRYHVGGFKGQRVQDVFNAITDEGSLYVTSKKVCFVGQKKAVTYPISKIVAITKYSDGIQLAKENEAKPRVFLLGDSASVDMVGLLISCLA